MPTVIVITTDAPTIPTPGGYEPPTREPSTVPPTGGCNKCSFGIKMNIKVTVSASANFLIAGNNINTTEGSPLQVPSIDCPSSNGSFIVAGNVLTALQGALVMSVGACNVAHGSSVLPALRRTALAPKVPTVLLP